jgi:hypothetical protein
MNILLVISYRNIGYNNCFKDIVPTKVLKAPGSGFNPRIQIFPPAK